MKKILRLLTSFSILFPITSNLISCSKTKIRREDDDILPKGAASLDWAIWEYYDYIGDNYNNHDINWWIKLRDAYTYLQQSVTENLPATNPDSDNYNTIWNSPYNWLELIPHGWYQCEIAHTKLMINILNNEDVFKYDIQKMSFDKNNPKTWWLEPEEIIGDSDKITINKKLFKVEFNWYEEVYKNVKDFVVTIFNEDDFDKKFVKRTGSRIQNYWYSKEVLKTHTISSIELAKKESGLASSSIYLDSIKDAIINWFNYSSVFDNFFKIFVKGFSSLNNILA